jgi:hypothetical protein
MTVNPARLGRRQVDVLRAAATGKLVRFDDGGWDIGGHACTQPARRLAELGMFAEGQRMVLTTFGSWKSRPGVYVHLSADGVRVLDAWELANPQAVIAHLRHTAAIKTLAAQPGPLTDADLLRLAANDETFGDDAFRVLGRAVDGRPVIDNDNA